MVTKSRVVTKRGTKSIPTFAYKSTYGIAIVEEEIEEKTDQIIEDEPFIYYVIKSIQFRRYYVDDENSSVREKIAHAICNYTTDYSDKIDTEDRITLWLEHKDYIYRLASCFLMEKDILEEELKNGTLTNNQSEVIYSHCEVDYKLYEIINYKWIEIKKYFVQNKKFTFDSSLELFLEIMINKINYEYESYLHHYKRLNARTKFKSYKLLETIIENRAIYENLEKSFKANEKHLDLKEKARIEKKLYLLRIKLDRQNKKLDVLTRPNEYTHYWERKIQDFLISNCEENEVVKKYFYDKRELGRKINETMNSRKFTKPPRSTMEYGVISED